MSTTRKQAEIGYWLRQYDGYRGIASPSGEPPSLRDYTRPLISVIVPCGPKHADLIKTALYSLDAQTFKNFEICVIDDTDEGALSGLQKLRPYVRVSTANRRGVSAARNRGIDIARGQFVVFLDADDYLAPDALEVMLKTRLNAGQGYVYTGWHVVDQTGTVTASNEAPQHHTVDWMSADSRGLHPVTVLMDIGHAKMLRFDEEVETFEDWDFFARAALSCLWGTTTLKPLLFYRVTTGERRVMSEQRVQVMRDRVARLYEPRIEEVIHMSCCGGGITEPLEVVTMAANLPGMTYSLTNPDRVLMTYTGNFAAPVTYFGEYQAYIGCPPIEVKPGDVRKMLESGVFVLYTQLADYAPEPNEVSA